jgi:mRNA interferase MazF
VPLPDGLQVQGVVLADHVKSLDFTARRAERACVAPAPVVAEVLGKLLTLMA